MKYTVQGRGPFPRDMLRYDQSVPCSMPDEVAIAASHAEAQTREQLKRVRTVRLTGVNMPRLARWQSFGWTVIRTEDPR